MNITRVVKKEIKKDLDPDMMLPDTLPVYVSSFVYMFGVLTMASLVIVISSGIIMVLEGPIWYQYSSLGLFFRSIHFWGAQVFFFFMIVHMISVFFMAGWREGRIITWMLGVMLFGISMFEAFLGYLIGGGFFAQWNQVQAKDAMNAIGLTGFINILNNSQIYGLHVVILPIILVALLGIHLFFVRKKGVVPPIE
jgi:ubiquinol-cytochrome c reductase cytochrome b subunit